MARREASCPLCGAKLTAAQVLDACEALVGDGILECHCPHCQGHFDVRPAADAVEIGYIRNGGFATVLKLPAEGLAVLRDTASGALRLRLAGRDWKFEA